MTEVTNGILAGVRVVEFAQNVAIPMCGRLLAGMGCDVVKVEPPGGDAMRWLAPITASEGKAYALVNPGKRSIAIDLAADDASTAIEALFAWADVALVAFKERDRARYGIDWETAHRINPRLVYLAGSAFGPEGPDAAVGGYDVLAQARSGAGFLMNRAVDGAPAATRPAINDCGTGIISTLGIVAALRHRDQTGRGQRVDTSLLGTAVTLASPMIMGFEHDAEAVSELREDIDVARSAGLDFESVRDIYESRVIPNRGAFRMYFRTYLTADGMLSVAGLTPTLHEKFHRVVGIGPSPNSDPQSREFASTLAAIEDVMRSRSTEEWMAAFREVEFPCGPYNLPYEAVHDEQIRANDYMIDLEHPTIGRYTTSGMPVRFSDAPTPPIGPSPAFAEHSRAILAEAGLDSAAIKDLVSSGTIVTGDTSESDAKTQNQ